HAAHGGYRLLVGRDEDGRRVSWTCPLEHLQDEHQPSQESGGPPTTRPRALPISVRGGCLVTGWPPGAGAGCEAVCCTLGACGAPRRARGRSSRDARLGV